MAPRCGSQLPGLATSHPCIVRDGAWLAAAVSGRQDGGTSGMSSHVKSDLVVKNRVKKKDRETSGDVCAPPDRAGKEAAAVKVLLPVSGVGGGREWG